jgi:outer membrane protein assembly factor BamB
LQKLVRLTRSGRNLRVLTEVDLEKPLKSAIIPLGSTVAAAMETLSGDALAVFDATTLAAVSQLPLNGNLIAGPFTTDFGCLLQTDKQILAVSESAEVLWTYDLENTKLIAAPLVAEGKLVLTTNTGDVLLVDSTTGKLEGQTSTGRPFSSAPLLLPAGLLIGSDEGAVLALPLPTQAENQSPQGGRG